MPHDADAAPVTIAAFQQSIRDRYFEADAERGIAGTWLWFSEEIGELARALARDDDRRNKEEEFADVLAWLCTLANVSGVDLEAAVRSKHPIDGPLQTPK